MSDRRELPYARVLEMNVMEDGRTSTSRGLGTASAFALRLVELLRGTVEAQQQADELLVRFSPRRS